MRHEYFFRNVEDDRLAKMLRATRHDIEDALANPRRCRATLAMLYDKADAIEDELDRREFDVNNL